MENVQPCIDFLKPPREDAFLDPAGRLFHNLAPQKEKHCWPFADMPFKVQQSKEIPKAFYYMISIEPRAT